MILKRKNNETTEGNIFWITMADLMTALVLVFMVLFLYSFLTAKIDTFQSGAAKENVSKVLNEEFKLNNIDATVDAISGVVKISDLELFDLNSHALSDKGKRYLDKFAPAYFNSLFQNEYLADNIDKIIIQGHTDSQVYTGEYTPEQQYMKNMELSLNRAYSVANYMVNTSYDKKYGDKLRKMIIVEGASSSELILENGKENYAKSRRVELKLVMKKN